jgi:diguanylate cyclase (GGDEF)-like protein
LSVSRSLITVVAAQLVEATASTVAEVSTTVLAQLAEEVRADAAFLRQSDHDIRASKLIAEWPPRPEAPDPDPLAVIHFSDADPVYGLCGHLKKPTVIRLEPERDARRRWIVGPRRVLRPSVAVAPLLSEHLTTGMLGLVRFADKKWKPAELDTIEAVAFLFAQIEARTVAEAKLRHLADHDELTGLLNRRALITYLSGRLEAEQPGPVVVLYLDLDHLKTINDYLSHSAGDWFIRAFADRLRACAGNRCTIARLGGDEFVVVPDPAMSADTAKALADRLQVMLRERVQLSGHTITRAVSIGVAVGQPGRDIVADVLHRADEAVLKAKRGGGNQVVMAADDLHLKSAFRHDIELHLQGDMDTDALRLHFLPEVDMLSGAVLAAEALVRWRHPTQGLLLPESFIGVAESTNLAEVLGQWVMRSACAEFARWRSRGVGQNAALRINVAPAQLVADGFVRNVADTIAEFGIDGGSVCLEITERAVVRDIETTQRTLAELKEVGIQIAIDDFGTGYAVLSHLKSLPVDILKIDRAFVRDLGSNPGDLAIVRAIIGLADAFDLQLVAEGVETSAAALTLMRHGCHRAQGFLLSRPLPPDAMEALLFRRWIPMPFLRDRRALTPDAVWVKR